MELNREKIIKALDYCGNNEECVGVICPYYAEGCENLMPKDALSLIKELTAENDRLKVVNKLHEQDVEDWRKLAESKAEEIYPEFMRDYNCMREELEGCYEEIARLRTEHLESIDLNVAKLKADTVRKMQERLKDRYAFNCNADEDNALNYYDLQVWVDQIAKEMLEGVCENTTN